ncbi:hypothetical protein GCM10027360_29700 [Amycolatopsis echigonensis]
MPTNGLTSDTGSAAAALAGVPDTSPATTKPAAAIAAARLFCDHMDALPPGLTTLSSCEPVRRRPAAEQLVIPPRV